MRFESTAMECVCSLNNTFCTHECYYDEDLWLEVEDYLMAEDSWEDEGIIIEPIKRKPERNSVEW